MARYLLSRLGALTVIAVPLMGLPNAQANIYSVNAWSTNGYPTGSYVTNNSFVMGMAAATTTTAYFTSAAWSTVPSGSTLNFNNTATWGYNDGQNTYGYGNASGYDLLNASARAQIRGSLVAGGYSVFHILVWTNAQATLRIWGPTLNNYGVQGAANNFHWLIFVNGSPSNSSPTYAGTGEATITIPSTGSIEVVLAPGSDSESGSVMVSADN
jgi:hypothetical protein